MDIYKSITLRVTGYVRDKLMKKKYDGNYPNISAVILDLMGELPEDIKTQMGIKELVEEMKK